LYRKEFSRYIQLIAPIFNVFNRHFLLSFNITNAYLTIKSIAISSRRCTSNWLAISVN
uniref:Transposase n=1 Tax=Brugia timori TaxID=42155 RepID=A0A0R3Q3I8_9BILA